MSLPVLSVKHLTKQYGDFLAVDHISFEIEEGQILGLLGPNGAGKSTTIQMLLGLTDKDGGEIQYFGRNFDTEREYCLSRINFASTYAELNIRMTVYQNLRIYAGLYNVRDYKQRITELTSILEIEECIDKQFWHLSAGQKTRVILAKSLLNRPRLLLMDEPTASLDPDIVSKVIKLIKSLQEKENITILFTSHNMDEVSQLCDSVAFLAQGKIVINDTPHELTKTIGHAKLTLSFDGDKKMIEDFLMKMSLSAYYPHAHLLEISLSETEVPTILFGLKEKGIEITSIQIEKPSLEDVFLHISQHQTI